MSISPPRPIGLLRNPSFRPLESLIAELQEDARCDYKRLPRPMAPQRRKIVSGQLGEQAVASLLRPLTPTYKVVDTNRDIHVNYPGADFIVEDRIRIQVKASPWFQLIGISPKPNLDHSSHGYDLLVYVDLGILYAGKIVEGLPVKRWVDFYVFPRTAIQQWCERALAEGQKRLRLHAYRHKPDRMKHHKPDMLRYLDRYDLIETLL